MTKGTEVGMRKWECGSGNLEVGSRTRRRPIGRDYAAAKDAEVGNDWKLEGEMRKVEKSVVLSIADFGRKSSLSV
jgi:hypothetical protein